MQPAILWNAKTYVSFDGMLGSLVARSWHLKFVGFLSSSSCQAFASPTGASRTLNTSLPTPTPTLASYLHVATSPLLRSAMELEQIYPISLFLNHSVHYLVRQPFTIGHSYQLGHRRSGLELLFKVLSVNTQDIDTLLSWTPHVGLA